MLTRGYPAVTTAQISKRANIGRSTFYLHYAGKEALLKESLKVPSSGLAECVTGKMQPKQLKPLLDHFYEQRNVNRVFFVDPLRSLWVKSLAALIETRLSAIRRGTASRLSLPRSLTALMIAESQIALVTHWLTGRFASKSETIAAALITNTRAIVSEMTHPGS